ncbi:MAG TPA: glycosyltransferase [Clostridia bacterium]
MIPKIIHYCWFGKKELPKLARKCIASWKKYMPEYEIKEWNEDNFDVNIIPYTRQAYENKKYAFVADYTRFYILNKFGGIYLDTDVELIKSLDDLISNKIVMGFERVGYVNPGLILISPSNQLFLQEMLKLYDNLSFTNFDNSLNLKTIVEYTTEQLIKKGLKKENIYQELDNNICIYPIDYFCPIDMQTNKLVITKNTYSIHHFAASWISSWGKFKRIIRKIIGSRVYNYLHELKSKVKRAINRE